ncbi:MAG: hypothetical protein JF567_07845 [Xanthomonadales bacterium]|nr:hypothetical protein [Xanthomonadales bacterium]
MTPLFKKLNLGTLRRIHVLNAPESFERELAALDGVEIERDARGRIDWALAFAVTQDELDTASRALTKAADGDAQLWIAYPKGSSKRYRCEFNRDSGWTVLRDAGFDTVRMVAIDEDWSALRFRRGEYIKAPKK